MAAKLSTGYLLDEVMNPFTGEAFANNEPVIDYVVTKIPKWPFDKFPSLDRKLGTQMKATGEVMGIDRNLERSLLKSIHSLEVKVNDLKLPSLRRKKSLEELQKKLLQQTDERFFILFELLRRGITIEELHVKQELIYFSFIALKEWLNRNRRLQTLI